MRLSRDCNFNYKSVHRFPRPRQSTLQPMKMTPARAPRSSTTSTACSTTPPTSPSRRPSAETPLSLRSSQRPRRSCCGPSRPTRCRLGRQDRGLKHDQYADQVTKLCNHLYRYEFIGLIVAITRGKWPYRPAATRAMRNRLVVLYDLN